MTTLMLLAQASEAVQAAERTMDRAWDFGAFVAGVFFVALVVVGVLIWRMRYVWKPMAELEMQERRELLDERKAQMSFVKQATERTAEQTTTLAAINQRLSDHDATARSYIEHAETSHKLTNAALDSMVRLLGEVREEIKNGGTCECTLEALGYVMDAIHRISNGMSPPVDVDDIREHVERVLRHKSRHVQHERRHVPMRDVDDDDTRAVS